MKRVKSEWVGEWKKRRNKNETLRSIAKDYHVNASTIYRHLNPDYAKKQTELIKKASKKRFLAIGANEKRSAFFYAYQLKDIETVKHDIISDFRKINTKDGLIKFLDEKEPLFSLYLLKDPFLLSEISKVNKTFCDSFGIEKSKYAKIKSRLYYSCYRGEIKRFPLPRSPYVYKITREGLEFLERKGESREIILSILKGGNGLHLSALTALFGVEKYGEPTPQPYSVFVNRKYREVIKNIDRLIYASLISKERISRREMLKIKNPIQDFDRRLIKEDEMPRKARDIRDYVEKEDEVTINQVAQDFRLTFKTARLYLDSLACAKFVKNTSRGTYSIK